MSEEYTNYGGRADYIDNGQWHLAVNISDHGFGAWLVPDAAIGRPAKVIVDESWAPVKEGLLHRIEDVVYDNPTVLDDFSADIILESDRQLWLPSDLYPADEDCADIYTKVYGGEPYDVIVNQSGIQRVAFALTPGLKAFMQRSFPGARIWSQLTLLKEAAIRADEMFKCVIDIRDACFDIVLLRRTELLCAASHPWKSENDIAYTVVNILHTYGADPKETDIVLSGMREIRHSLGKMLTSFFKSVSQKNHDLDGKTIPTAVYLAINRKKNYANYKR